MRCPNAITLLWPVDLDDDGKVKSKDSGDPETTNESGHSTLRPAEQEQEVFLHQDRDLPQQKTHCG